MYKESSDFKVSDIEVVERGCGGSTGNEEGLGGCARVKSENLGERRSKAIRSQAKKHGAIARLPVTLSELEVRFFIHANIDLPEPALEIKDIKKNLRISQCRLLQPTNILFIKGYIRKKVDYYTKGCSGQSGSCGDIRHCSVNVPFEFTTPIKCREEADKPILNKRREFEYLEEAGCPTGSSFNRDGQLSSESASQFNQESIEFFNKKPFCDLIYSRIVEFDEYDKGREDCDCGSNKENRTFNKIEERMVVELGLRILQEQQVAIPAVRHHKGSDQEEL